jgi:lipopolysaccharide export system protein LptA
MNNSLRMLRIAAAIIVFFPVFCVAQDRVVLEHADSLIGLVIDGEQARELIGHVHFTQGTVDVRCERAIQYTNTNRISLEGNAEVWDGTMRMVTMKGIYDGNARTAEATDRVLVEQGTTTLKAEYGKYTVKDKRAFFKNHVIVEDTSSVLTSDELTWFREEEHSIAVGHVRIHNLRNNLVVTGEHFEGFKKRRFNQMTGRPKLLQVDTTGTGAKDTLVVTCRTLETIQDTVEQLIARDSVTILRGALSAEAGFVEMFSERDSLILLRSPFVWYTQGAGDDNQLSGDTITLQLRKRRLERVIVRGTAMAISNADSLFPSRLNQMSGEEIVFRFDTNGIRQIDVDKTATSLYYLFEGRSGNGCNKTTGDHVTLTMNAGRVDRLKVTGGVEGQYVPERLLKNRETDYNLRGFNWREHHPGSRLRAGSSRQ